MRTALDGNSPIFQQVKAAIEEDILNETLTPDAQIPSNRQLVALWEVNPMTVMKGVGLLADEGILYKKRGEGMFVAPGAQERLRKRLGDSFRKERLEPLVRLAAALGIGLGEFHAMIDEIWPDVPATEG
ncbi:MAG: GntR family transcriptional regulator [Clostridiales bacterium]|nr:GntR family transcriptional regulator [Clostridiales bacterium]